MTRIREPNSTPYSSNEWNNYWNRLTAEGSLSTDSRMAARLCGMLSVENRLVLEMGAGFGTDGLSLMKERALVVFVDFAFSSLIQIKNRKYNPPCPFMGVCADVTNLPFRNTVFDAVMHQGLMEHFPDPEQMLSESRRILKPGGTSIIDVPQKFHFYTLFKHVCMKFGLWNMGWETEYTPRHLAHLMEKSGFRIKVMYGAWSRPSLLYRLFRELLRPLGIRLPLRPPGLPLLSKVRNRIAALLLKHPWALWTVMDIGVAACKPDDAG